MKRHALVIDHEACWGCKTCEVACKQENETGDGVRLISVCEDGPRRVGDTWHFYFQVRVCRHCDDPPCAKACPEKAVKKRDDGIVVLEEGLCTGCGSCIEVCPYDAVTLDPKSGNARKCNLCHNRVDNGLLPACADNVCMAHCIHFTISDSIG